MFVFFVSACSVLLAGDDIGSVWLYDVDSHLSEKKTKDILLLKQAQVNTLQCVVLARHRFNSHRRLFFSFQVGIFRPALFEYPVISHKFTNLSFCGITLLYSLLQYNYLFIDHNLMATYKNTIKDERKMP